MSKRISIKVRFFFVGTATIILRYAGFTILTDPNFLHAGDHIHLGYGLTSERLTEPAINIEVLSHYHGDHFDRLVFKSPLEDFKLAAEKAGLTEKSVYLNHGEPMILKFPPIVTAKRKHKKLRIETEN